MKNGNTEQKKEAFTGKLSVLDNKLENLVSQSEENLRNIKVEDLK